MADTSNLSNYLKDVADAIRTKKETTEQIPAANFDTEILSIQTGLDAEPIYATTDYIIRNLPNLEDLHIQFVYRLDMYYLILTSSSEFYLYKLENNDFVFLGDTGIQGGLNGYCTPGIIGYDNNYVYIYRSTSSSGKRSTNIFAFNLSDKSCKAVTSSTAYMGDVLWSKNGYFIVKNSNNVSYLYTVNINGEDTTLSSSITLDAKHFSASICDNIPMLYYLGSVDRTLTKIIFNVDSITTKSTKYSEDISGVNFYGNKVFLEDGVYELLDDLSIGEKLNSFDFTLDVFNQMVKPLNDKFYALYDSYRQSPSVHLYTFNEDTNTLELVETISNIGQYSMYQTYQPNIFTAKSIYVFVPGDMLIGYKIDGQNIYLNQNRSLSTDKILSGYTSYSQDGSPISGTMPNNGELNYNSSTEEQTIPAGYTSGGTIAPAPITQDNYNECLELSEQILGENVSL